VVATAPVHQAHVTPLDESVDRTGSPIAYGFSNSILPAGNTSVGLPGYEDGGTRVKGHQSGALLSLCQQGRPQPIYLPISLEQAWCDQVCQHVGSIVRATWRELSGLCVGIASMVQSS
jgi:hypothetical protein